MMTLFLGHFANAIHESQGGLKVGKLEGAHDVMLVDDIPLRGLRQLLMNFCEFASLQRRYTAAAGDAVPVGKRGVSHGVSEAVKARQGAELRSAWTAEGARPHRAKLERNVFIRNRRTASRRVLRFGRALIEVVSARGCRDSARAAGVLATAAFAT